MYRAYYNIKPIDASIKIYSITNGEPIYKISVIHNLKGIILEDLSKDFQKLILKSGKIGCDIDKWKISKVGDKDV